MVRSKGRLAASAHTKNKDAAKNATAAPAASGQTPAI
jgi:hypothetical protein